MLDVALIREDPERVRKGVAAKQVDPKLVDEFLALDAQWRLLVTKLGSRRAEQKKLTETRDVDAAKKLKEKVKEIEKEAGKVAEERGKLLERLPNLPFPDVPVGKDEGGNVVVRKWGEPTQFDFEPKNYMELAQSLDLIDTKAAGQVAGTRFGYIKRAAVLMEFALVKLGLDTLLPERFVPVLPPVMAKPDVMRAMGKGKFLDDEDAFYVQKDDLYLVGSAEHTLGPLHMNDVLREQDLPRRYIGFSTAFRREAGSYGKDTRGILRVHQFDKLEMFSFAKPEDSEEEHRFLVSMQEKLMQALKLPYRVVAICTGDMTWTDARQYDIETWFPGEKTYRETHSGSNATDFQSRGINARYRAKDGELRFVHTLNATAFAQRPILAILENCQNADGTVRIPKVLQDYMGGTLITKDGIQ